MKSWARLYSSYARYSFAQALELCGAGPGDVVLIPGLICREILAPITQRGCRVEFYAVDRSLRPVLQDVSIAPRVILAVDYFGFPQDLSAITTLAKKYSAYVVEDNAHGYLSRDSAGVPLGERTGIGFVSFRKTLRVANGAYLTFDPSQFPNAGDVLDETSDPASSRLPLSFQMRQLAANLQSLSGLPLLNASRFVIRGVRVISGRSPLPESSGAEDRMPEDSRVHESSLARLDSLDESREKERRKQLYFEIASRLRQDGHRLIFETLEEGTVPWCVPIYSDHTQLAAIRRTLRGLGVEVFRWPELPSAVERSCPEHYSTLYVASMMQ